MNAVGIVEQAASLRVKMIAVAGKTPALPVEPGRLEACPTNGIAGTGGFP